MALKLHVTGTVHYGELQKFTAAVQTFCDYRHRKGYCVPQVFIGLSGAMNTVLMVFDYASATDWEKEECTVNIDPEYATVAREMPFIEGSINYILFQPLPNPESRVD